MKNFIATLAFLTAAFLVSPAMAQDEGLYDPVAPAGSAFVRFINQATKDEALKPVINGKTYREIGHSAVSAYFPLKEGKLDLMLGTAKASGKAESAAYYTAVLKGDALTIIKDTAITNAAKAVISFYNLSDKPLSLKTADGKVEVIPAVEAGKSGYREINGVPVTLAAYEGDKKVADVGAVTLKRNEATAVIVSPKADGILATVIAQAKTDTKQ